MESDLRRQIYGNMNLKETDDLIRIWQENDRAEWSDLTFDVIREILIDRTGELPKQTGQIRKKEDISTQTAQKYAPNKILLLVGYSYLALFTLLLIAKGLLPDESGGWSDPPIFDFVIFAGCGVCFTTLSVIQAYYAWTLNAKEYVEWNLSQVTIGKKWARKYGRLFPDSYALWSTRIIAPIGAVIGLMICTFVIFEILS